MCGRTSITNQIPINVLNMLEPEGQIRILSQRMSIVELLCVLFLRQDHHLLQSNDECVNDENLKYWKQSCARLAHTEKFKILYR